MLIVYGLRSAGRIHITGNQLVSTVFFHLFFLPIIPIRSIRVTEKRSFLDAGEQIPFNRKSILAAYLRNELFGILCLGFALVFDGLFLDSVVDRDKPSFVIWGTSVFVAASLIWMWASFILGARSGGSRFGESSSSRLTLGIVSLVAILVSMFFTAHLHPRQPTLARIASDYTLTDENALKAMANLAFKEITRLETIPNGRGMDLNITYVWGKSTSISLLQGQDSNDAARIHKTSALLSMYYQAMNLIEHGRSRHLTKLTISLTTTVLGQRSQLEQVEIYRISIPQEKFAPLVNSNATRESITSPEKLLTQLGVVDVDNFSLLHYQQIGR